MKIPSGEVKELNKGYEQPGVMNDDNDQGLSRSLVEGNKERMDQGMLLDSSLSQGLFASG